MIPGLENIEKDLRRTIENELSRLGLLYRLFSRTKTRSSLNRKILRKGKYEVDGAKVQDMIGLRVITYFNDDIEIVYSALKGKFEFCDETIDEPELTVFKPKRTNIICRYNDEQTDIFEDIKNVIEDKNILLVDNTFELQLRTILSEGWHEIDHNLRYKSKEDWNNYPENERLLNGIYASLETSDQTLKSLFNELSFKHYKNKNWEGMLRNKFRLNFQLKNLDEELNEVFDNDNSIAKKIFKLDRTDVLKKIANSQISLPMNFDNLAYIINKIFLKNRCVEDITPNIIKKELDYAFE